MDWGGQSAVSTRRVRVRPPPDPHAASSVWTNCGIPKAPERGGERARWESRVKD